MRRYLLVLDVDLLAVNEELDQEPINYLIAQQEQQPCDVVVLSMMATRQAKLSPLELVLGAATAHGHPCQESRVISRRKRGLNSPCRASSSCGTSIAVPTWRTV